MLHIELKTKSFKQIQNVTFITEIGEIEIILAVISGNVPFQATENLATK